MRTEELIPAKDFCLYNNIELSFIYSLNEAGLIQTVLIEEDVFVHENQIKHLEKMVRFYNELDINLEGIETISYLLNRIDQMQQQIVQLSNKLSLYENL